MPLEIVVGTQWGDEGKGRIVDLLAKRADLVVRYNGGDNAGHTVTVDEHTFKLHLIPSGVIHAHTFGVLGNGMVINPATLIKEMDMLRSAGVEINPQRLSLSYAAPLITPMHQALDRAQEISRGQGQIGTTGRGIGPAYADKASRRGLRVQDMLDGDALCEKLRQHIREGNLWLERLYGAQPLDEHSVVEEYSAYAATLRPYISDGGAMVWKALSEGKCILAEGAQGTLLDLDFGTYPYVTSSNPTAAGALLGMGIGAVPAKCVIGITKAFQTRVGEGPFPTELSGEMAGRLRGTGANPWDEFGTTTGRPRRVGWLDGVLLRYAVRTNGLTELTLTKLDILSGLPHIHFCTSYTTPSGQSFDDLPYGPADLSDFSPVYEELPGWQEDVSRVRRWDDLPAPAREYIRRIEAVSGVPVRRISVGPERDQVIES
jgi:adenylosuccinate synthase